MLLQEVDGGLQEWPEAMRLFGALDDKEDLAVGTGRRHGSWLVEAPAGTL